METPEKTTEQITQDVIEKYQQFVNPTQVALLRVGGFDHIEHQAEGVYVTDLEGTRYLDCLGGYGVFSLGHRHPKVVEAVKRQLDLMPLASKTFLNKPLADVCAKLASLAPGDLQFSFFCNSGAEAVEGAIKFARCATGKPEIIAADGGYHGKTMGALSATGRETYRAPFGPMVPGFIHVAWNDFCAIEEAVTDNTAAILLEPVQGEGGIHVPHPDYFPQIRRLCDQRGILLIADEVQTGLGRTGTMFALEHWNVAPDIMTLSKCLGGGVLPVGAFMATPAIWDAVFRENPFLHTSTFGGGELACVAALTALEVTLEEKLPQRARENGAYFLDGLKQLQLKCPSLITDARGLGLMLGLEFGDSDIAKLVIGSLAHRGVIVAYTLNNPNVIRLEPPLVITQSEIDIALAALDAAVADAVELLGDLLA